MTHFETRLRALARPAEGRQWLFVANDQLSDRLGVLANTAPDALGIVLVESRHAASLRPYHQQSLAMRWANQRHFALEQAARGVAVRYMITDAPEVEALREASRELGPLTAMRFAEREQRRALAPLIADGAIALVPHDGWLSTSDDFETACPADKPWRMDAFYRHMRRRTGLLMDADGPRGGRFSFDAENRERWPGSPPAPELPRFVPDAITDELVRRVAEEFSHHPGRLDPESLPATQADAERLWAWAQASCLPNFGPFEDAMSSQSSNLFHTRISALVNMHRLLPRRVIEDAIALDLPLAGLEGFVRQILGWREYVRHVHDATDGFRRVPGLEVAEAPRPGDGGYAAWAGRAWADGLASEGHGGALPSYLGSQEPLPPAYWGQPSGLACLDRVVEDVWKEGYSHHITRLMVLSNLATMLDVSPRALADWFWVAYTDAWDWVVEPNVLGMATFGAGPVMTTKPYVAGSAYIKRMSDYCGACAFKPTTTCPLTRLYWAFLARHAEMLRPIHRMAMPMAALGKRSAGDRLEDERTFEHVRTTLARGESLAPAAPTLFTQKPS